MPLITFTSQTGIVADVDAIVAANARLSIAGWSARETASPAGTATFRIIHGALGSGSAFVDTVELAPNESTRENYGAGIAVPDGISIDWQAGTFEITIRHQP